MEFYHDPYADELLVKFVDYICSWIEWAESKWYPSYQADSTHPTSSWVYVQHDPYSDGSDSW